MRGATAGVGFCSARAPTSGRLPSHVATAHARRRHWPGGAKDRSVATSPTKFGRLIPDLPAICSGDAEALVAPGVLDGPLDATDDVSKKPRLPNADLGLSASNSKNPAHTAATTFAAQFVDHDALCWWTSYSPSIRYGDRRRAGYSTTGGTEHPIAVEASERSNSTTGREVGS